MDTLTLLSQPPSLYEEKLPHTLLVLEPRWQFNRQLSSLLLAHRPADIHAQVLSAESLPAALQIINVQSVMGIFLFSTFSTQVEKPLAHVVETLRGKGDLSALARSSFAVSSPAVVICLEEPRSYRTQLAVKAGALRLLDWPCTGDALSEIVQQMGENHRTAYAHNLSKSPNRTTYT